ncbi:uncharacterized protein [Haliotis cracherodii]|uniref:uncharacterized protein isoform X1 n=2 Tax=Haliotis cracherodii TaxID=6455 RepID=UPI0039E90DCC
MPIVIPPAQAMPASGTVVTSSFHHRQVLVERRSSGMAAASPPSPPTPAPGPSPPEPVAQKTVLEQMFERKLVEGDFWYVVVAEWLEHLKRYVGLSSTRKYYPKRVTSPPGPIVTRRDYAHTADVVHEDVWRMLIQWYGLSEGHKPMKLVVYHYSRAAEIEHNQNSFKVMLSNSPPEDFHNVRFSKMEKVGHVEWKIRELYHIPQEKTTRMWAKADVDSDWRTVFYRDKTIGRSLDIDSDFTRPIVALEVSDPDGIWNTNPETTESCQDSPIGPLVDHDIFEDVTSTWEIDIHDQIDHIGKSFLEKLHSSYNVFVQRAKDYVDERESRLRHRERDMSTRERNTDMMSIRLEDRERRLHAELVTCEEKIREYERRRLDLERDFRDRMEEAEEGVRKKQDEMDREREQMAADRTRFESEIKRMSEMYKIQDSRIKLDIGGHLFTTSLLTLTKDPDSMLAAMFSGRHELKRELDGSFFIDRDGTHFRYILNYLRDGCIKEGILPQNENLWRELLTEAEYYQLSGLVDYLSSLLYGKTYTKDGDTFV